MEKRKIGMWAYQMPSSFLKDIQELLKTKDAEGTYMTMINKITESGGKRKNIKSAIRKAIQYYS